MKQKNFLVTIAIVLATLISGCAEDDFQETAGVCPLVIDTNPDNAATNVPLNQVITVTFNEEMDPSTINSSSFIVTGASTIAGTLTYSGVTATFTPSVNLTPNTTYVVRITTAVKDLRGNALQEDYLFSFSTGATLQPLVLTTSPTPNETGVVLNKIVSATFNMPMDPATINTSTFTLKQGTTTITGVVTYSGNTALFTPNANLTANTVYTATITTGAHNMAGVALASNYVWNFTTGAIVAPRVILTDPFNTETGVLLNKVVTATFDMAMDPLTITTSTFTLKQGTDVILGSVSYSGNMASFTPNNPLLANAIFTATITTGAKNVAGIAIANNYVWTFKTINSSNAPDLGSASPFGAFGGNAGITNQGINTVINGSIATTAASTLVTGFHDATAIYTETPLNVGNVTGAIATAPPMPGTATSFAIAQQALLDANAAYLSISPASMPGGIDPGAGELGGLTLAPGIYKSNSGTFNISNGNLTLDAQGDPNTVWIFQTAAGLTVGIAGPTGAKSVVLINGALPKNVFWYVGSTAIINGAGGGTMVGTIIANSGVTFSTAGNAVQTVLNGRALSLVSSVTMVNTTINVPQ
ncbi:Ig-like domain-containing protein [Flavobacterium cheniae]|uniref:Ig-like domain-containing protein n=1 Tax=Flavobacterium cheniae TaxID=295428 RepID=A0A562KTA7_9FLAO|nr:Ig-like domain-containing protein [Flavobacterium cheniae]TDR25380.1 Ig-like domain-containing protein [Flavobacterium cheniae]TWH98433.1 Ig-like domain-containing protein [Flavobacterium cheniae]